MDTEETIHRQADGIRDETLQANTTHQMATDDNERGVAEKSEMPAKRPLDVMEKAELI